MKLNKPIKPIILLFIAGISQFYSCTSDNFDDFYNNTCITEDVTYSGTLQSILDRNCLGCHYAGNAIGVTLETYEDVKAIAESGRLLGAIKHLDGYRAMPLSGNKLDSCTIAKFEKWVNDGTPNN